MTCEAKTMARKMIVPTTKMMTMMKTTQSTPGTIEQSSVMYSLKSDGRHCTWCDHIHYIIWSYSLTSNETLEKLFWVKKHLKVNRPGFDWD